MKSGLFQFDPSPGVVPPGSISNAELAPMAALTVKANPTNASGQPQDVAAASNDTVFRRVGNVLDFGVITDAMIAANTFALSKLANATAQYDIIGRKTAGAGAWEDCTRTDLLIAGTNLANVFTAENTINTAATRALRLTQTTTGLTPTDAVVVFESTDSGANGPAQVFYHNSASPAANDLIRQRFYFNNASGVATQIATVNARLDDPTAGSEDGRLIFSTAVAGAITGRFAVGDGFFSNALTDAGAGTVNASALYVASSVVVDTNRLLNRRQYTFGTLPAAGTAGRCAAISDGAAVPVWLAAAAGGGAVKTPVYDNGTAWVNG